MSRSSFDNTTFCPSIDNAKLALKKIMAESGAKGEDILAIGISYQMHEMCIRDSPLCVLA